MNRFFRTAGLATATLACTLTVAVSPASAAPTNPGGAAVLAASSAADPAALKQKVTERIDKRLTALKKFSGLLTASKQLDARHRTILTKLIADQTVGLTKLRAKVQSETSREALKADAKAMVDDFRVFILTARKVRLTIVIDTELAAAARLKLTDVQKSLDGQVDKLLALQPGPDGKAIRDAVKPIHQAAKDARTALKEARKNK